MGIFVKQGVLNADGTVTDAIWDGYVTDVMKKLASGNGTIPGVQIGPSIPPLPGAAQLNLKDKKLFGDFHNTWRPKYEAMVRGIDTDGSYNLNKVVPFLFDPTAAAKSINASAPPLKLDEALAQMLVPTNMVPEPAGSFFSNTGDKSFTEVEKLPGMSDAEFTVAVAAKQAENASKLSEALAIPPLPPIPQVPDIKILELGYTEQYTNEINSALSPTLSYPVMASGAGMIDLAEAIASSITNPTQLPAKVMEAVGNQNAKVAPPSMQTSTFEIAANSVFEEHRAKYTAAVMLAQNIGHGVIVDALSATPFDQFGFEIMREPEEVEEASALLPDPLSGRRYKILKIIEDYLGPPPNSYVSILENKAKFEEVTKWEAPEAVQDVLKLKDAYKDTEVALGAAQSNTEKTFLVELLQELRKTARDKALTDYLEGLKELPKKLTAPVATTCNAFPPYVIARKLGMKPSEYTLNDVEINFTMGNGTKIVNQKLQLIGGLDTMRRAARLKGCWVDAMSGPNRSWDPSVGLPKPGDVLLISEGNRLFGDGTNINVTSLREKGGEPWDTDARHVGFLFDSYGTYTPDDPDYETYWLTADAGQGSVANGDQRVSYVNRPVVIPPVNNEVQIVILGEQNHYTKERKKAYLAGWLDVDKLPIAEEKEIF